MNVLSLFDGMSCGQIALNRAGIKYDNYYASEIDKYAIKVTQQNYPNTIQLGDVTKWKEWDINWPSIGLVTGGFPCQAWSVAGNQLGDKDERGKLFWVMLDIIKKVLSSNPNAYFLIENVKMKREFEEYITFHTEEALGKVSKHLINSALVSAQNRNRYYWTNIEGITQPEDKKIYFADVIDDSSIQDKYYLSQVALDYMSRRIRSRRNHWEIHPPAPTKDNKSNTIVANYKKGIPYNVIKCGAIRGRYKEDGSIIQKMEVRHDSKTNTLTTVQKDNNVVYDTDNKTQYEIENVRYRKLTPEECEILQTIPMGYSSCVSNSQRYKMIGNGWTVDVIAHIFSFIN